MRGWQPGRTLADVERESIEVAYRFYGYNKSATASSLGISLNTFKSRIEEYGFEVGNAHISREGLAGFEPGAVGRSDGGNDSKGEVNSKAEGNTKASEEAAKQVIPAQSGVHVESDTIHTQEQSVSMRKRKEIQKMSSSRTATSGT